ncbi:MAG: hypothetical protein H7Z74_02970 [Anaerolineae bacterium]|nr:hypothetical protein [Gemmatimonadaceae bacterium]
MSDGTLHHEPPSLEAYSRVTNPERFLPLHALALALVDQLTADYDVERTEAFALLPDMQPFEYSRPPVTLMPLASEAAPIAIAFTAYPGLVVRCGRWFSDSFPSCGCDACDETAGSEGDRLDRLLADVVAGRFREELTIPWFGDASLRWAMGDRLTHSEGRGAMPRDRARALRGSGPSRVEWQPWRFRAATRNSPGGFLTP